MYDNNRHLTQFDNGLYDNNRHLTRFDNGLYDYNRHLTRFDNGLYDNNTPPTSTRTPKATLTCGYGAACEAYFSIFSRDNKPRDDNGFV